LPAGELRFCLQIGLFGRGGPLYRACGATRHPSFGVGFRWRVEQFALSTPLPDATAFSRGSFSPRSSGAACATRFFAPLVKPQTLCALRLREPHRDDVTSGTLCRTTALAQELHLPPSLDAARYHLAMKPATRLRHARTRTITACLRPLQTLPRTPSFGLMSTLAAGLGSSAIPVRSRVRTPHPFEQREPAFLV